MAGAAVQSLLNISQPKVQAEIDKPIANKPTRDKTAPPEKPFDHVLKSQQDTPKAQGSDAAEPSKAANTESSVQEHSSTEQASSASDTSENSTEELNATQASQADTTGTTDAQSSALAQADNSLWLVSQQGENPYQTQQDLDAILPTLGKDLPLTPEQQVLLVEQLQALKPGQTLSLSLDQGQLKLDVLNAEGKLLKQDILQLSPQQTIKGVLGLQTANLELGKSEADQLLGLLQKSKVSLESGGDFQQALKQIMTTASSTVSNPATPSLAQANMSYRFVDGQLHASSQVPTQVGKPGWGEQVNQQVAWFSSKNISVAEIKLDPPDLGPLQVRVSNNGDQTTISFTSAHAQVRDALDQNLPRLREMLAEQGVDLADVDVGGESQAEQEDQEQSALADADTDAIANDDAELDDAQAQERLASDNLAPVGLGLVDERV